MHKSNHVLISLVLLTAAGCGTTAPSPVFDSALIGGVAGSALGAGAGALIANNIDGGEVGESALLGGAIGLAAGAAIGAVYEQVKYERVVSANQEQIDANTAHIRTTQIEAEIERQRLLAESSHQAIDQSTRERLYDGPTIGQYRR